jgi:hypothetical protein
MRLMPSGIKGERNQTKDSQNPDKKTTNKDKTEKDF